MRMNCLHKNCTQSAPSDFPLCPAHERAGIEAEREESALAGLRTIMEAAPGDVYAR